MYTQNNVVVNCHPGTIVAFPGTITSSNDIPGWALCDGSSYNTVANPTLFSLLGSSNLPNLNGAFLRGTGTNLNYTKYVGPNIREFSDDKLEKHKHSFTDTVGHSHLYDTYQKSGNGTQFSDRTGVDFTQKATEQAITGITLNATGTTETKPLSYSVNWIIKLG
jgi:microcystin-dependent protein